jgi:iron(III) transport system ATP-binding protein
MQAQEQQGTPFLRVEQISRKENEQTTLQKISFQLAANKKLAIVGETGSGKSTLLKMIAGHLEPSSGKIFFWGERVFSPPFTLLPGHPGIAYLSQHFELRNNYKVHELLSYRNLLSPESSAQLYKICQVDQLMDRKNDELSGGERQRVALAKLLVGVPKLLLLDEPFSNLDLPHKQTIQAVIHAIAQQLDITCIMVSHDPIDTLSWADEIMVFRNGELIQYGTPQQVYQEPANEYCAALFGSYNLIGQELPALRTQLLSSNRYRSPLVRPEQLMITENAHQALDCVVTNVQFCGAYWRVSVVHGHTPIIIHTQQMPPEKGALVWVKLV